MAQWVYRRADGLLLKGRAVAIVDPILIHGDPVNYGLIDTMIDPDDRTLRVVDGPSPTMRAATGPELAAYDAALLDVEAIGMFDNGRVLNAMIWACIDSFNPVAPATIGKFNAARTKILAAYKNRPWMP